MPKMIDDMLRITIDPIFPPEAKLEKRENAYELIYCTHSSKYSTLPINKRRPFTSSVYPVKSLA